MYEETMVSVRFIFTIIQTDIINV